MNDLVESGFISKDYVYSIKTGKRTRNAHYQLKDNYIRFFLKYIKPRAENIKNGIYQDANIEDPVNRETITGIQFENLVLNNAQSIIKALSINPNAALSASPNYQNKTALQKASQIDLLIQTN